MVRTHTLSFARSILRCMVLAVLAGSLDHALLNAQSLPVSESHIQSSEEQTASLIAAGIAAFDRDDIIAARELFQKVLAFDDKNVTAHTYLGLIADRAGDLNDAEQHFSAAAKWSPSLPSTRNNYGAILMRLGRPKLAATEFEASLKLDSNQPNALINLAQIRFAAGTPDDLRAASELFARAYVIKPDVEIARALIVVSLRRQDYAATPGFYRAYIERLEKEKETMPQSASARAELGAALLEAGLLNEAETELLAALSLDATNVEAIMRLARVYLARKDLPAAGRTLEGAVARGVDAAPIYALLAEVYEQSGHMENAIPAMRLAIQRDPQSEKYRFAYGVLLTNAYAPAAAVIRLEEALKMFPDSSRLWFALGLAHFKHDQDAEANAAFTRAVQLDPKFAPAFAYLGLLRVRAGAYSEANEYYEKALQSDPKLAVVHYLLADSLLKLTDVKQSRIEAYLKRAVELDPTFTPARLSLAKLFMRENRWTEAVGELQEITKLDPNVAEAYYHLGRAYARLKQPLEAQQALASFKRLSETEKARENAALRDIVKRLSDVRF